MREQSRRWYAHGDQMEGATRLFYCAVCQRFIPGVHFRRSLDMRCRAPRDPRGGAFDARAFHRAADAPNLFRDASLAREPARRW